MIMSIVAMSFISLEEQLVEMARAIAKLTKTIEDKDMQIVSLLNRVKTQVQNRGESS